MIRTSLAANPRRRTLLVAKTGVVAAVVLVVGLAASGACFLIGQAILRSNGFTYENGYPAETLADGSTFRAVGGSAVFLAVLAVFSLGVGAILRHTAGAITTVLTLILAPVIAISFLPESIAESVEKASLLGAGLAIQQTVERSDSIPLTPLAGLGVVCTYAAAALLVALWLIAKRDASVYGPPPMAEKPLLVLDGDSLAHRAYHALPKSINQNAVVGFTNFLVRLWEQEEPRTVFVGWDTLTVPTYRHEALPAYQSGREFDDSLLEQLDKLPQLVEAFGFAYGKAPGYEADDFVGAAAKAEEKRGGTAVVVTSDRDMFQLASDRTVVVTPVRGVSELARIGPAEVRERYGVDPEQVPDFIALRGDPSDRIPGAPGVGPKTAATILNQYGSLDAALDAGRFPNLREELELYRRIATVDASAPLPPLKDQSPAWAEASSLLESWGLKQSAGRIAARSA